MKKHAELNLRRRTKIVGTLGPASDSPAMIESLIQAGLNVARIKQTAAVKKRAENN